MKSITLLDFLKGLKSYNPAFRDVCKQPNGIRISKVKCIRPLSDQDFAKFTKAVKGVKDVYSYTNSFVWKNANRHGTPGSAHIECFVIKTTKPLSEITVKA